MGLFSKKKKEEPVEVEAEVKRTKSAKKETKSTGKETNSQEPKVVVQLSGSEMYLADMINKSLHDLELCRADIEALKADIADVKAIIVDNLEQ